MKNLSSTVSNHLVMFGNKAVNERAVARLPVMHLIERRVEFEVQPWLIQVSWALHSMLTLEALRGFGAL